MDKLLNKNSNSWFCLATTWHMVCFYGIVHANSTKCVCRVHIRRDFGAAMVDMADSQKVNLSAEVKGCALGTRHKYSKTETIAHC